LEPNENVKQNAQALAAGQDAVLRAAQRYLFNLTEKKIESR
jgi:hypothetical protein